MDFQDIIQNIQYAAEDALGRGLDKAADRLLQELSNASPSESGSPGEPYRDSWVAQKKSKKYRVISNTKTVTGKGGTQIPLSNILENGGADGDGLRPHIKKTFDRLQGELADIIMDEISFN